MTNKRPYYRTKAAWAAATAARLRTEAARLAAERIPSSDWRAVQSKMAALASYNRDVSLYERLAEKFAAEGV